MVRGILFVMWVLVAGMLPLGMVMWTNWMVAPDQCWATIIDGRCLLPWLAWAATATAVGGRGIIDCP